MPALHGGQRVDVVDGPAVAGEAVGGGLVEAGEGEIERGAAAAPGAVQWVMISRSAVANSPASVVMVARWCRFVE